jgi:hypothetical protein
MFGILSPALLFHQDERMNDGRIVRKGSLTAQGRVLHPAFHY